MRAAKIDANQPAIVDYLRSAGASVQILSAVGKGCPDLLVGWQGDNLLLEVKVPKGKGQSAGTLTDDQVTWHAAWRGQVVIVRTLADCDTILRCDALRDEMKVPERAPPDRIQKRPRALVRRT
jgi:hypothetical protein